MATDESETGQSRSALAENSAPIALPFPGKLSERSVSARAQSEHPTNSLAHATENAGKFQPDNQGSSASRRMMRGARKQLPGLLGQLLHRQQWGNAGRFVTREAVGLWSPDPLHLSLGASPYILRRLEMSSELKGHRGCVNTISCTPDGKYWITGSDDTMLMIWDGESERRLKSFHSGHTANVFQGRALPFTGNEKIITCAADGQVRLTHLSRERSTRMGIHRDAAHRLAIEPGSPNRFMSCGEDGAVLVFDLRTAPRTVGGNRGVPLLKRRDEASILGMALNPADPNYLFICGMSSYLDLYDARKTNVPAARYCPGALRRSRGHITGCAVNHRGTEVIATYSSNDSEVYRFDVIKNAIVPDNSPWKGGDRSVRRRVEPPASSAGARRPRPGWAGEGSGAGEDDDAEVCNEDEEDDEGSDDVGGGTDRGWNAECSTYLRKYTGHSNVRTVKQVTFYGPNSEFVVSGSDCGHIFFWDKETADLEMLLYGDKIGAVNCLEPHPFLPTLATSGFAKTAKIWRPTRVRAVPMGKLTGKAGKPASDVVRSNERTSRVRREMVILNIPDSYDEDSEDEDLFGDGGGDDEDADGDGIDDARRRQRAGGASGRGGGGEVDLRSPSLRRILMSISRARLARLGRWGSIGDSSDSDGDIVDRRSSSSSGDAVDPQREGSNGNADDDGGDDDDDDEQGEDHEEDERNDEAGDEGKDEDTVGEDDDA